LAQCNLCYADSNAILVGALDDCHIDDSRYIPWIINRGSELSEDPRSITEQLDCYCLMLEYSGFKTKGLAYLVYYWPEEVHQVWWLLISC
jgi:hypothetical protein